MKVAKVSPVAKPVLKDVYFWPGINRDIESHISRAIIARHSKVHKAKVNLEPINSKPSWHTLGMDLFTLNDRNFLIIADYLSK